MTPWVAIKQKACDINIYNIVIRRQCLSSIISVTNHIIIDWVFSIQGVFLPLSMISNTLRLFITKEIVDGITHIQCKNIYLKEIVSDVVVYNHL